jgi:hypothetical protein
MDDIAAETVLSSMFHQGWYRSVLVLGLGKVLSFCLPALFSNRLVSLSSNCTHCHHVRPARLGQVREIIRDLWVLSLATAARQGRASGLAFLLL